MARTLLTVTLALATVAAVAQETRTLSIMNKSGERVTYDYHVVGSIKKGRNFVVPASQQNRSRVEIVVPDSDDSRIVVGFNGARSGPVLLQTRGPFELHADAAAGYYFTDGRGDRVTDMGSF